MGEHVRAGDLDIWTEQVGARAGRPADRRSRRHRRVVAVPARRARRPLPPDRLRQPRRGPDGDAGGPVSVEMMADDAADVLRALDVSVRPRGRFLGRQHHRPGAGAPPPRLVRSLVLQSTWPAMDAYFRSWVPLRPLAGRRRPQRARRSSRGSSWTSTRRGRTTTGRVDAVHRRGARLPPQAVGRGPAALPGRLPRPRHDRSPARGSPLRRSSSPAAATPTARPRARAAPSPS